MNIPYKLPDEILFLPENKEEVFGNADEFLTHYYGVPYSISLYNLLVLRDIELSDKNIRKYI